MSFRKPPDPLEASVVRLEGDWTCAPRSFSVVRKNPPKLSYGEQKLIEIMDQLDEHIVDPLYTEQGYLRRYWCP